MATVNREICETIIENNGYYEDDPRVFEVLRYIGMDDKVNFAITYSASDLARYRPTEYVRNPKIMWERGQLTEAGIEEFKKCRK